MHTFTSTHPLSVFTRWIPAPNALRPCTRPTPTRIRQATSLLISGLFLLLGPFLLVPSTYAQGSVTIRIPDTSAAPGDTVVVPVHIGDLDQASDVSSYGLDLALDDAVVSYAGFEAENTLTGAAGFTVRDNPDIPRIGAFGSSSLNAEADEGPLLRLVFDVEGEGATAITLEDLVFDGGNPSPDPAVPEFALTTDLEKSTVEPSGSGEVSFGDTGVEAAFEDVQQEGTVEVAFFPGSVTNGLGSTDSFENVSSYRWDIGNQGVSFTSVDVSFLLSDADIVGIGDPSKVKILVAPDKNGPFEAVKKTRYDDGGTPDDATDDRLVAEGLKGFSSFKMASNDSSNPLPVELAAFTATADGSAALLRWRTASETNNAGFEVQHWGPNASSYEAVDFVDGASTTTSPQTYRSRIEDLGVGSHQFRLRQVDTGGASSLSNPVAVTVEARRALALRMTGPNPARQETTLTFTVQTRGRAEVALYNVLGQQVRRLYDRKAVPGERYAVDVDAGRLPSGSYFARLSSNGETRVQQIVVVR